MNFSGPIKHLKPFCLVGVQIVFLSLIWIGADFLARRFFPFIPGSVLGLLLLLLLLGLGVIRSRWLVAGGSWLLSELLLFFVPAVLGIVQYPHLLRLHGEAIAVVVLVSTACVMLATAWVVDCAWKLEMRWRMKSEPDAGDNS